MSSFNYIGPFNRTGYGIASAIIASKLAPYYDKYIPISGIDETLLDYYDIALDKSKISKDIPSDSPSFVFWHIHDLDTYMKHKDSVLYTTFEVENLGPYFKQSKLAHTIAACTATPSMMFALKTSSFVSQTHEPIAHGSTLALCKNQDLITKNLNLPLTSKIALSTCGKYEVRKSQLDLIIALSKLDFTVDLIISCYNPHNPNGFSVDLMLLGAKVEQVNTDQSVFPYHKYTLKNLTIYSLPYIPDEAKLYSILFQANFFVSLSKSEGWNLPLYNALVYQMPCIVSHIPVHQDITNSANSILQKANQSLAETKFITSWRRPIHDPLYYTMNALGSWGLFDEGEFITVVTKLKEEINNSPQSKKITPPIFDTWQDLERIPQMFQK